MSTNGTIELPPIIITPNPPPLQPPKPIPGGGYIAKPQPWVKGVGPITKLSDLRINLDHDSAAVSIFVVAAGSLKTIEDAYKASVRNIPANLELQINAATGSNVNESLQGLKKKKASIDALLLAKQTEAKSDTAKSRSFFGRDFLSKDFKQNGVDFANRIYSRRDKDAYYNLFIAAGTAAYNVKVLTEEIRILTAKTKTFATKIAVAQAAEEKAKAEAKRLAEEKAKAEAKRLAEEKAKAEAKRLAEEKAKAEAEAKRLAEEKAKADDELKDAIKFTADFYKDISERFGTQMSTLAQQLSEDAKGKVLRNADEALRAFDQYKDNLNKKFNVTDRTAIANALESLDRSELAKNLNIFGKAFGYVGKAIDAMDLLVEIKKGYETGDWNSTVLKVETLFAGAAATGLIAFAFGLSVTTPMGIVAFGLIMALVSAFVNDARVKMFNDALDSVLSR
ncbi:MULTISPECIES: colicin-like pore-forming protein [Pseudomonas]|uniref:colicin-like pore-forming protein n=1 Tax=Pseudomonas TaxID=286 RepID=UPI00064086CF|nr:MULTISPECIES: colicin-like pore-forming protein [Pseudomonas]SIS15986.1 Colicin pore forming domain-containing protein [Pseudomonas sp. A214]